MKMIQIRLQSLAFATHIEISKPAMKEGRLHRWREIWLGDSTAKKFVNKYPPNASVTVYLNPKKPTKAVLEPQQQPMAAFGSILFGVTLVISGSMVWFSS